MERSATAIDSRWESPMQAMHRAGSGVIVCGARMQRCPARVLFADACVSGKSFNKDSGLAIMFSRASRERSCLSRGKSAKSREKSKISREKSSGSHEMLQISRMFRALFAGNGKFPSQSLDHLVSKDEFPPGSARHLAGNLPCTREIQKISRENYRISREIFRISREIFGISREIQKFPREIFRIPREILGRDQGTSGPQTPVDRAQSCPSKHPDGYIEAPF